MYGAVTRSEALVFTDDILNNAYGSLRPGYLDGSAVLPAGVPPTSARTTAISTSEEASLVTSLDITLHLSRRNSIFRRARLTHAA